MSEYNQAEFLRQVELLEKEATPGAVEKLIILQQSSPDDQKRIVAKALARIGAKDLRLITDLLTENSATPNMYPYFVLMTIDTKEAEEFLFQKLIEAIKHNNGFQLMGVLLGFAEKLKDTLLPDELFDLYDTIREDEEIKQLVLGLIVESGDERKEDILLGYLHHPDEEYRAIGATRADSAPSERMFYALQQVYLNDENEWVRKAARYSMEKIQQKWGNPNANPEAYRVIKFQ
jgi:HEAT repeat protein